jgi:glycosyltransferase involved in cell wall biosynthesis
MTAAQPFVSFVIPVYNDAGRLARCLEALEGQTYPRGLYEVIVVDNGSDEPVAPVVARFPSARACAEPHGSSFAARNAGFAAARGEVFASTDADCLPARDWIERGVAALAREPWRVAAGRIEIFCEDAARPTAVELYEMLTALRQRDYVELGGFAATANLFVFREVFERVGPFRSDLKSGGDVEWGRRARAAGCALVYADEARVAHPARRTFGELHRRVVRVAGGLHDLQRAGRFEYHRMGRSFLADALPPLRDAAGVLRACWPPPLADKLKIVYVLFFVQYAQVLERLRLKAGGSSRR